MNDHTISNEAKQLHQEARQHGGDGAYDLAIEKLKQAIQLAPDWAYPVYDLGYTYLLQHDFANALKYYELTDKMEPKGFFTAKTAHWSLQKEKEGAFPEGLYLSFMQIEWMNSDEEKLQLAKAIVTKFPAYAPAWKIIASKSDDNEERLNAIEKGINLDPDSETAGNLLLNKALVKDVQKQTAEAKIILEELLQHPTTTTSNYKLAEMILSNFSERK